MTSAYWPALIVAMLLAAPASAQYRATRLSEPGRALVESTPEQLKQCRLVYTWERCKQPVISETSRTRPDPERRAKCIISSRNVAAKKGATHYLVQGPVFTGYRCDTPASARSAFVPVSGDGGENREASLGFSSWASACLGVEELFDDVCATRGSIQAKVTCRERRARALMEGERIYRLPSVKTRIDVEPDRETYTVQVLGVLTQLGARSDQRYVTVGPLVTARRGTTTEALADAARPFTSVTVSRAQLKAPKRFKRDVRVEALVRPKATYAPVANNPARIQVIEVDVVGLRAHVPDLSWGEVLIPSNPSSLKRRCRALDDPMQGAP
ncbi:MAG: hypothetical protein ACPGU1_04000 [Myxococcota bacterium]